MGTLQGNRYNYLVVFFATLGSITYGFGNSIMGTVLGLPSFFTYFDLPETGPRAAHTQTIIGTTQGLFYAGGVIGCGAAAWLADSVGRRRAAQIICLLCIVSAALQAGAVHIAMLLVGRLFNGAGSAMINVVIPLYQSEISPPAARGRMVGSHGTFVVMGYAFAAWTGLGCYFATIKEMQWRLCLALQTVTPLILWAGSHWIPESPRWLIAHGQKEKALHVLTRLHDDPRLAQVEANQIEQELELESDTAARFFTSMRNAAYRKRFLIGLFVQCLAQSTGVLVINNYQIMLYSGLGLSGWMPLFLYGVYTTWASLLNLAGSWVVDRAGRVRMLCIGMLGCAAMVACEAAMVAQFGGGPNKIGNGFGVLFLFLFVTFYGGCVDAISYVYCSEIFPTTLRAQGMAFSIMGLFAMTLLYTQTAPVAFDDVGWKFYLVFIVVPLLGLPVLYFVCPETKGVPLEQIGALFDGSVSEEHSVSTTEDGLEAKGEVSENEYVADRGPGVENRRAYAVAVGS